MSLFNKVIRFLTRVHDARNARSSALLEDANGIVKLSDQEKVPSVMLAFHAIETKTNEDTIITLLSKIFEISSNVKVQYSSAGETLLFAACKRGQYKVITYLIDSGLNCSQVTPLGTAMHSLLEAFTSGKLSFEAFEELTRLLQQKGCDINEVNYRKMTPYLCAVEVSNSQAMSLYINLHCDINKPGISSYHAIHLACLKYRPDTLNFILSLDGVEKNPISSDGSSGLYVAVKEWSEKCSNGTCFEATHLAVRMKEQMNVLAMVEKLLLTGSNPYLLSTKKKINLPSIFLQTRQDETKRGRWCSNCQQKSKPPVAMDTSLEHYCDDPYIGCPCKLTLLYTSAAEVDNEDGEIVNPCISRQSTHKSSHAVKTTYSNNHAVPLTSQMLATCLLYSHFLPPGGEEMEDARDSFFTKSSKMDIDDPYVQYLIAEFSPGRREGAVGIRGGVASLKVLSRSTLRIELATNSSLQCIAQLPLPKLLLNYLSMKTVF